MNHPNRRRRQHFTFYFLIIFFSFSFIIRFDRIDANLYSEFNNGLDLISNYAENRVKQASSLAVNKIYENQGKLLEKRFEDIREGNADKLKKVAEIEKLMDVLAPYYRLPKKNYDVAGRIKRRENEKWHHLHSKQKHKRKDHMIQRTASSEKHDSNEPDDDDDGDDDGLHFKRPWQSDRGQRSLHVPEKISLSMSPVLPEIGRFALADGGSKWPKNADNFPMSSIGNQQVYGTDENYDDVDKAHDGGSTHATDGARKGQLLPLHNRCSRCMDPKFVKSSKNRINRLQKRYNMPMAGLDPKQILNSAPSVYPNIIAKTTDFSGMNFNGALNGFNTYPKLEIGGLNPSVIGGGIVSSGIPMETLNQITDLGRNLLQNTANGNDPSINPVQFPGNIRNSPRHAANYDPGSKSGSSESANCAPYFESENVTTILERVLDELQLIKEAKVGNYTPDGTPCDIIGSWNSEIIGARFDISLSNRTNDTKDIVVGVKERYPQKRYAIMDPSWTCMGAAIKRIGGPFYITGMKRTENAMATFTGFCMRCGKVDTVFGSWTILNPAKDCTDIPLAFETKRDVFRRDLLHDKITRRMNPRKCVVCEAEQSKKSQDKPKRYAYEEVYNEENSIDSSFYD